MKKHLRIRKLVLVMLVHFLCTVLGTGSIFAQTAGRTLTGTVTDEAGSPLPGVSISVKGTSMGAVTDVAGKYSLSLPANAATLVFSFIGFQAKEVPAGNHNTLNVSLSAQTSSLNEVVVVGYATQKKVNLTGSVANVNFKELENTPQANTLNILSGRVAGLSVVQPGGQPGDDTPEVFVRGLGTLNDASPLVIIDGVQASLKDLGNLTPQEIGEISVLKDASSAAIYGARGANGVILVTTKAPGKGKLRINLNSYYGLQQATYMTKFVESWQWLVLHGEATDNLSPQTQATIEKLKNGQYSDTAAQTDWYRETFRTAPISNYNISVNGGSQNISFQGSLGYQQQEGVMRGTDGSRYNFRTNVNAKISEKLEAGLNLWGYNRISGAPFLETKGIIDRINKANPTTPLRYSNGMWGVYSPMATGNQAFQNPVLFTQIGYTDDNDWKGTLQTHLQYTPLKGLKLRSAVNYTYGSNFRERFNPTFAYPWTDGTIAISNVNNQLLQLTENDRQMQWQTIASYNKKVGQSHEFNALAGHEYTRFHSWRMQAQGFNLPTNSTPVFDRVVNNITVQGNRNEWRLQSFFGRLNYVLKDRYLLEGNLRVDGSSRFPRESKYGYFPSFSAGWILSEEPWFKTLVTRENFVNLVKVRGGYGQVGNDRIGNYSYNQVYDLGRYYNFSGNITSGGAVTEFANPAIKWESTTTSNLGVDLGFFANRLNITYDLFNRYTNDILYRLPIAPSLGIIDPVRMPAILNVGEVSNKGWDLLVNHRNKVGKLNYDFGFNLSYVKNKVEKLNTREAINDASFAEILLREGEAINSYYGYVFEGLYRTEEDLQTYPAFSTSGLALGTMRFKDVNKDGKITPDDRTVLGNANTPYTFGFNGGLSYRNLDFSFLFQGIQGKSIYLYDFSNRPGNAANTNFWKEWWEERFDPVNNPEGTWPSLRRGAPEAAASSSFWLRDASYVRLKNVELGYTLPENLVKKVKISRARVYVAGQNLLTFSNLIKQVDPERATGSTNNQNYPQTKLYTIGFNTTF